jgi:hypothetical protein
MDRDVAHQRLSTYILEVAASTNPAGDGVFHRGECLDALFGAEHEVIDDRCQTVQDIDEMRVALMSAIVGDRKFTAYAADYRGNLVTVVGFIQRVQPTVDVVPLAILIPTELIDTIRPCSFSHAVAKDEPVR